MKRPFQLEWAGGASERHFRRCRPGVDDLPWGTLDPKRYPPALVDAARISWTEAAYNEYVTAHALGDLVRALLAAGAPIDLVAMAADFVADEMLHVELTSRLAMELGGGAPRLVDFDALSPPMSSTELTALEAANELVVRLCCVGEAFSVQMLGGSMRSATHPLTRAVLDRIIRDEAPHGRFGWLYLTWISERLDDAERARLGGEALRALRSFAPLWQRLRSRVEDGVTSEGYLLADVRQLGWMESSAYATVARDAVRVNVVAPLARFGIVVPAAEVAALIAPS